MVPTAPQRSRRAGFRPTIEVLEDRNLLSGGTLDPTFGNGGAETLQWRPGGTSTVSTIAVQADGKIVVAGLSTVSPSPFGQLALVVSRLDPDGSLDPSFGTNGEVIFPECVAPAHIAITTDGKIVIEGGVYTGMQPNVYLARLNPNGSFDVSFTGTGSELIPVSFSPFWSFYSLALQPDGKIVFAGADHPYGIFAYRVNADGSMDSSFGQLGEVLVSSKSLGFGTDVVEDVPGVTIQPDGKLLLPWTAFILTAASNTGTMEEGAVTRLNSDGSLDTGFGQAGSLLLPFSPEIFSVTVRTDGEILAAGLSASHTGGVVTLLTAHGNIDTSFGNAGFVVLPDLVGGVAQIVVRSDGSMALLGETFSGSGSLIPMVSVLRADGSLDPDFGTNGEVLASSFPLFDSQIPPPSVLSIQPDGDILFGTTVATLNPSEPYQTSAFLARLKAPPVGAPLLPKPLGDDGGHQTISFSLGPVPVGSTGPTEEPRLLAPVLVVVKESGTAATRHDSIVVVVIPPADAGLLTFATTRELLSILFSRGPSISVVGLPWGVSHDPSHRPGVSSGVPPLPSGGGAGGDTSDDAPKLLAVPVGSPIDLPPAVAAAFAVSLPLVGDGTPPDTDADTTVTTSSTTLSLYFAASSTDAAVIESEGATAGDAND